MLNTEHSAQEGSFSKDRWQLNYNWATIAEELNELDVPFENEQEAIVRVTDAIGASLDIDLDAHPDLRDDIEAADSSSEPFRSRKL